MDAVEIIHKLVDGSDGFAFVDGDVGFVNVRPRPFEMGTVRIAETMSVKSGAHGGLGGAQLAEQRLPSGLNGLNFSSAHEGLAGAGCGLAG